MCNCFEYITGAAQILIDLCLQPRAAVSSKTIAGSRKTWMRMRTSSKLLKPTGQNIDTMPDTAQWTNTHAYCAYFQISFQYISLPTFYFLFILLNLQNLLLVFVYTFLLFYIHCYAPRNSEATSS